MLPRGLNIFSGCGELMKLVEEQELHYFCRILFDLDYGVPKGFLSYIQLSGLKVAYRKKVRETHPDLAVGQSFLVQRRYSERFLIVQRSYEKLTDFIEQRDRKNGSFFSKRPGSFFGTKEKNRDEIKDDPRSEALKAPGKRGTPSRSKFHPGKIVRPQKAKVDLQKPSSASAIEKPWEPGMLYQGTLPARPLLFGHYLYYSGVITWKTIVDVLVWQRKHRQRLGELGFRMGWLTKEDILNIIRDREDVGPFGESAIRRGLLSDRQLFILLNQQKKAARKFGEYFLDSRIFTVETLEQQLEEFRAHNLKHSKSP